jgi:hypothetical protein
VGDGDNSLDADTQGNNEQLHDHSNNRHLKSIKYGNQFPNRNLSDWDFVSTPENWLFEVLFDYGEHDIESGAKEMRKWRLRRDPFSRYSAGFEVRTSRLCQRLLMIHHFSEKLEVKNRVVSFVSFEYNETEHASFLRSVTSHGIVNNQPHHSSSPIALLPILRVFSSYLQKRQTFIMFLKDTKSTNHDGSTSMEKELQDFSINILGALGHIKGMKMLQQALELQDWVNLILAHLFLLVHNQV